MKSSFLFRPKAYIQNNRTITEWLLFLNSCDFLAQATGEDVLVTMQHSLKTDEFAVLVELPKETFSFHDTDPRKVLKNLDQLLIARIKKGRHADKEKKSSSGEASGKGRRRKGAARKRSSGVLQRRRPQKG